MIPEKLQIYGKSNTKSLNDIAAKLESSVNSFSSLMGVTVAYYDTNNNIKWCSSGKEPLCLNFDVFRKKEGSCRRNLMSAASIASEYSEPYIFLCRSGLVKIAFSLYIQGENCGCFMAGPFIMGELKPSVYTNIFELNPMEISEYSNVIVEVSKLKTYAPKEVDNIAILLRNSILGSVAKNNDYLVKQQNYERTTSLNTRLQKSKHIDESLAYPHDLENNLSKHIREGNTVVGLKIMSELLNRISIIEAGELGAVKVALIGIFSNISKAAFNDSVLSMDQMDRCFDDIEKINLASGFSDITRLTSTLIEEITEQYRNRHYSGNSLLIKETMSIVYKQYSQKITLSDIADKLHTNPSYLSSLFKKEMNITFIDFLNNYRIEKSIDLLTETSMNFSDIAANTGFDDQGYFSKVFKKNMGLTPREYKKKQMRRQF